MRFVLNSTGTILSDRNCSLKNIFACEVSNYPLISTYILLHRNIGLLLFLLCLLLLDLAIASNMAKVSVKST
jgi:hypothetical protein